MKTTSHILSTFLSLGTFIALPATAAVTLVAEYHLGEAGSLGANNLPQDSSGNGYNLGNQISGSSSSVGTTGVSAPGSTAYIDTSGGGNEGWYGTNILTGLQTDDFALGVYVRASSNTSTNQGDIFTVGGSTDSLKLSLATNGWGASANNTAWIGTSNGVAGSFTDNTWVHLALIRSGGITTLYIDGAAQGNTWAGTPVNNTVHISVNPGGAAFFDGQIDEARIVTFDTGESTQNILNTLQAVPEPSSVALLGIGGLALILRRRK